MREKVEKYFRLLYPNYDSLSSEEIWYSAGDKNFIIENIEEIDKYYQDCMKPGSVAQHQGLSEQEIIANAVRVVKGNKYFEMLHPEYETLTPGEKIRTMDDQGFILDNIDQIDRKFQDMVLEAERNGEELNEQKIIRNIVEGLKTKELTTQQIGKATINVPTTAKVEAEQVENDENTKDNVKEGEEVGDDN